MSEMRTLVAGLPDQLRWAAELASPEVSPAPDVIVAGMGGSGIAGDVAVVVAESHGRRVTVHKTYGLPRWVTPSTLVVAVSHSGNTEETLSAYDEAVERGLPVASVSVGGALAERAAANGTFHLAIPDSPQPRAALGRLAGAVLGVVEAAGAAPGVGDELGEAADVVQATLAEGAEAAAETIAEGLYGRVAVIYGGDGVGAVAAGRWKAQINENGKAVAFWATLPEANHNEIVGWEGHPALNSENVGVVFLEDAGDHERVQLRSRITRQLMERRVPVAGVVGSAGSSAVARIMSLTVVGDLVSVSLAERGGIDPVPVEPIEALKRQLADPT